MFVVNALTVLYIFFVKLVSTHPSLGKELSNLWRGKIIPWIQGVKVVFASQYKK
jgi:hypothetical protein